MATTAADGGSAAAVPLAAAGASPLPEPPFPLQLVEEFGRAFSRAVKIHQLYLPNNPIYQRAIEQFKASLTPIWEHTTELGLQVMEAELRWMGRPVLHEPSRTESLPWSFYKDGLRELTILPGFEGEESTTLLDLLQRLRTGNGEEDDLLTLLWEQEFSSFRYRYIDIALDGVTPVAPAPDAAEERRLPLVELRAEASAAAEERGIIRAEQLDSTLYFLDDVEVEYLRTAVQRDQHENPRRNVIAIALDIFDVQQDEQVRLEVCEVLEQFLPIALASGDYAASAFLLRETAQLAARPGELSTAVRDRLQHLPVSMSAPGVLPQLLQSLDDAPAVPPQEDLDALFAQLQPGALATILSWSKQVRRRELRGVLDAAAARLASEHTGELLRLMGSDDPVVAIEAMRRAGDLRTAAAVGPLAKLLASSGPESRQAAAQALARIGSPGSLRALESALDDADREVRLTAVRAIGQSGHRNALPVIEQAVVGSTRREADLTERMAYFEAFARLAGESGVQALDDLLNARGALLRRRVEPEVRACAAMALGRIGGEAAHDALRRAAGDKDPRVRSAIHRALREGDA